MSRRPLPFSARGGAGAPSSSGAAVAARAGEAGVQAGDPTGAEKPSAPAINGASAVNGGLVAGSLVAGSLVAAPPGGAIDVDVAHPEVAPADTGRRDPLGDLTAPSADLVGGQNDPAGTLVDRIEALADPVPAPLDPVAEPMDRVGVPVEANPQAATTSDTRPPPGDRRRQGMTLLAEPPKPAPVAPSKPRRSPLLSFGFIAAVLALVVAVVIVVVVVNQSNSFKQANPGSVTSVSVP